MFETVTHDSNYLMVRVKSVMMSTIAVLREVVSLGYRPVDWEEGNHYNQLVTSELHGPQDFIAFDFDAGKVRWWRRLGNSAGVNYSQDIHDVNIMEVTWHPDSQGFVLRKVGVDPTRDQKWLETRAKLGL